MLINGGEAYIDGGAQISVMTLEGGWFVRL